MQQKFRSSKGKLSYVKLTVRQETNPKRTTQPYISKIIPTIGQRTNMKKSPRRKEAEPYIRNERDQITSVSIQYDIFQFFNLLKTFEKQRRFIFFFESGKREGLLLGLKTEWLCNPFKFLVTTVSLREEVVCTKEVV